MGKFKDLTGMRFGKLTVIERAENYISPSGQSQTVWKCKCDCGNPDMIKVAAKHLLSNKTKSCGCKKHCTPTSFEDLTGQRFGRLTVIKRVENHISPNGRSRTMWECQCDCDNKRVIVVPTGNLKSGHTQSCGCLNKERLFEVNKKYNDYEVQEDYVIMYTAKGEPFYVDLEDFWKVKNICWCKNKYGYLTGYKNKKQILLHRYVIDCPDDLEVDHIHGTETIHDNRKENLRIANSTQNKINRKINNRFGCSGIYKNDYGYYAQITINNKCIYLGSYQNIDDAIKARKEAEEKYFGEWSYDNSQHTISYNYGGKNV